MRKNSHHAPLQSRLDNFGLWLRCGFPFERHALAVVFALCFSFLFAAGCGQPIKDRLAFVESGWSDARSGNLDQALKIADQGLQLSLDPHTELYWRFLTLKAEVLMRQGHYEASLNLLQTELPAPLQNSDVAVWKNLISGISLAYLGRLDQAQPRLDLALTAASNHPQLLGEAYLRRGTLFSLQWDLPHAIEFFHRALDLSRKSGDVFLETAALGSLGVAATRMEHYDESIAWNMEALARSRSINDLRSVAKIEGNTAWSYYLMGDFENALSLYQQARQDSIRAGLQFENVLWLTNSGVVNFSLRNYQRAEEQSENAAQLARELKNPVALVDSLENLAVVLIAREKLDSATRVLADAAEQLKLISDRPSELYFDLLTAQLAAARRDFENAERLFDAIARAPEVNPSLRWEAEAGLAQIHALQGKSNLAEKEFQQAIFTISNAQESIQKEDFRLSFLSTAIRFYDQYVSFCIGLNRSLDGLRVADKSRAQTLERGLTSQGKTQSDPSRDTFEPQQVAKRQNAALMFYWLGETKSYLWAITPQNVTLFPLPPRSEIDSLVASYRKAMDPSNPRDPLESGNPDGQKLYDLLVRPAEKFIPRNSRVIVLPDGSLTGLNFETLIVSGPQPHYWIDDVTISVANSLSLLAHSRRDPPPSSPKLLFFGDVVPASKDFPPLADSQQELSALSNHFSAANSTFFTRNRATPSGYLSSDPGRYSFLHFATHGTASVTRPLESAIILSPEREGSFKLYGRDIVTRPLNAYLVSISACNGAGERVLAGEGLVGLSWAFLRAGAHNVVAGLWEVSTASAPPIFDRLYEGVTHGEDPATALRNAKLALVHSKGPQRRPFYWAPFQLYSGS